MAQKGFYFDSTRCTGCTTCELACKDYKNLDTPLRLRKVLDIEGGDWTADEDNAWVTSGFVYHISAACNHCDMPACVAICPVGAIAKNDDNGLVTIDAEICIGCGSCLQGCPYNAPKLTVDNIAVKCDGCFDRVSEDKMPICVESCPLRALEFGDIEELRSLYGDTVDIEPLASSRETSPNLVVKTPSFMADFGSESSLVNELETL